MTVNKTYFISDVHLTIDPDPKRKLFISFLEMVIKQQADLYILGDFFDFWANNKNILMRYNNVLSKLEALTSQGSKVGFLIGNRDFLVTKKTLKNYGIAYLGEETKILLGSKKIFLAHGHTLCRSDIKFLKYKEKVWPLFRFLDKFLPGIIENYIANKFILKSKKVIAGQAAENFEITLDLLKHHFKSGIDTIICGHIHKLEENIIDGKEFFSLPAWEDDKGCYLLFENNTFNISHFKG